MVIASISIFGVIGSAFADPCPCSQVKNDLLVTAADIPDATYKNPAELLPAPQIFFDSNLAGDGGANLVGGNQAPPTVDEMLNGIESEFKLYKNALEREDFDGALLLKDSINLKFSILHAQNIDCSKFEDDIALLGDERVWKLEMERWEKQHSQKTDKPEDEGCSSCPSKTNQNIPEEPPEFTDEELERIAQEHSLIISEAPEQRTTNRDIREYSEEIEHRLGKFDLPKPQISQAALDSFAEYVLEDPIVDSVIIVNNEGFNIFISRESIIENFGEDKLAEFEAKRGDYPGYVYQKAKGPGFMEHIQLDPEFIEERTRLADEHFYIDRDPATEVLELRTDDARHFRNPDGSMTAVYRAARPSTRGPMEPMDTQIYSGPPYANSYDYASNSGLFSCWYSHAVYWSSYNMGASAYYEYGYGGYYYWNCAIGPETDQCYEFYRSSWEWYLSGIPIYSNITSTYINMYVLSYNMAEFNTSNLYVSLYNMARRFGVEGMNASQHWTDCGDGNRYIYSLYLYTGQGYTGDQNLGATCNSDVSARVNGDRTFGIGARYYTTESSADRGVLVDGDFVYLTVNYNPPSPDGCNCATDGRTYNTYVGGLSSNYWWEHTSSLLGPSTCRWYYIYLYSGSEYNFTTVRGVSPNSNADFDTYLRLYDYNTCVQVDYNDDQWAYPPGHSFLSYCPTTSGWYLLSVGGYGSSYGNYTLGIARFTLYGAPTSVTVSPSSICLGGSVSITSNGGYGGGNYITYGFPGTCGTFIGWNYISSWTPPSTGTYTIWTERRNSGDYYGQSCLFGSNMGSGGAKSTTLTVVAQPTPPTSATRTPTDATVCVGALLQITGASGGNAGVGCVFQYRFLRGGIVVQDWSTSNNSYMTTSADAGYTIYAQLRRSNCQMGTGCNESAGSGNLAQWNVVNDPTISISGGTTVCWGSTDTLSSSVSGGTGTFYYQWQYYDGSNWQNISGATGSTYAANPSTYGASTQYRCILTCSGNGCDGATSNILTVNLYNNGYAVGYWIGNYSSDWADCRNWGKGRVPNGFGAIVQHISTYDPIISSAVPSITTLTLQTNGYLRINSGGSLTTTSTTTNNSGCNLTISGGTLTSTGTSFNNYGTMIVSSGTWYVPSYFSNQNGSFSQSNGTISGSTVNFYLGYGGSTSLTGGTMSLTVSSQFGTGGAGSNPITSNSSHYLSLTASGSPTWWNRSSSDNINWGNVTLSGPWITASDGTYQRRLKSSGYFTINSGASLDFQTGGQGIDATGTLTVNGLLTLNSASDMIDANGAISIGSSGHINSSAANLIYCAGNWTNSGTFTHGNNTVYFDGGSATITTGGSGAGKRFYNLNITGGTKTQNGAMGIDNDINITGTLAQGANEIYVTRNWNSASGSVTSVSTSSNTYCNGSVSGTITSGGNYHFGYLQISKSSASYGMTLIGNVRCTHLINNTGFYDINSRTQTNDGVYYGHANSQLRMSTGIMYVNGTSTGFTYPSFYMASGATENITGGNIYISGYGNSYRAMMVNGSFAPSGGTVHFTGGTSVGIAGTGTLNFYNLRIAKTSTAVVNLERSFNVIGEYDASATTASDGTSGGVVPGGYEINF